MKGFVIKFILIILLQSFISCKVKKSAIELSSIEYSHILNKKTDIINTTGTYVLKDTILTVDETLRVSDVKFVNKIETSLIKFNKNKTVQLSNKTITEITNDNITEFLNANAYNYYYLKGTKTLILEKYKGKYYKSPWYAFAGPRNGPYKVTIKFEVKGNTLINKKTKKKYILNNELNNNHAKVKFNFKNKN